MKYIELCNETNFKSKLMSILYSIWPKYVYIVLKIIKKNYLHVVYSNFVNNEGIQMFMIFLRVFSFTWVFDKFTKQKTYLEYNWTIDKDKLWEQLNTYKKKDNMLGDNIKVILLWWIGAEGINLANVKYLHIIEPHWNEWKNQQIIGRAVRRCWHVNFEEKDRFVKIYRYLLSVDDVVWTDQYIYELSIEKQKQIDWILTILKQWAVNCKLFAWHNKLDVPCFEFAEEDYFNKSQNMFDLNLINDVKYEWGLYSLNSELINIDVYKTYGCYYIGDDLINIINSNKFNKLDFSEPFVMLLDKSSGHCYDFEGKFIIGKIKIIDEIPIKFDDNTYIIFEKIIIPDLYE